VRQARLHGDILADAVHIGGLRPGIGTAEFGEQLRMRLVALFALGGRDAGRGADCLELRFRHSATDQRRCRKQHRQPRRDPFRH
jgi:hypothetical protein